MKRILVSNGDASGDLILSKVIEELKKNSAEELEFVGLCGPLSQAQGVKALGRVQDVAVVGAVEVLRNLRKIFGTLTTLGQEIDRCDSLICVDFPDFNLRLATLAKKKGKPVDYIIAPQVWAWRSGRLPQIKNLVRKLYPALPFEEEIFREAGVNAQFLGHPLRDLLPPRARREARQSLEFTDRDFVFCVMPGSRHSEIKRHLPILLKAWELCRKKYRDDGKGFGWKAVLPMAKGWRVEEIKALLGDDEQVNLEALLASGEWKISDNSHRAQMAADFGWITSGTATLEAAYYQLPHILVYKLNALSVFILARLTSYFSRDNAAAGLPNILLGKNVIPELLQNQLTPERLAQETLYLLNDATKLFQMKQELRWIPKKLGEAGATRRIAQDLLHSWNALKSGPATP